MPPTSNFGQDITNTNENNGNRGDGGDSNNNNGSSGGGGVGGNISTMALIERMGGRMMIPKVAGRGVIRVVSRCDEAKENNMLNLSGCELMHVPDAVYHLMRNTELTTCDLSANVIRKIPPKFAIKFNLLTDLSLANNQLTKLPDELSGLERLLRLDISHNSFLMLPAVVFKMPQLRQLLATNNAIIDVEPDHRMIASDSLELVDLRHNPLTRPTYEMLRAARVNFHIELSERKLEEWEDLNIN